jgi:hypothetical protein
MTTASGRPSTDRGAFVTNIDPPDDDSDITPTDDRNARKNERKREEKTIKFRFKPNNSMSGKVNPSVVHLHWIALIQEAFGDKVHIFDNNNKVMPTVDLVRWDQLQHQQHFKIHRPMPTETNNYQESYSSRTSFNINKAQLIIHRIQTTVTLREIKNAPKVCKLLVENSCYLYEHNWQENVWNTTHLGFMVGIDPQYYDVNQATMKISNEIHKKLPRTKVPPFRLVFSAPRVRNDDFYATTKAYAIETEKSTSLTMMQILKETYQGTATFVPFQLRSKHTEAYVRFIRQQSRILASHHVIIMQNIGPDAMFYLVDHIQALPGVIDVTPSKTVESNGNHRILVQKDQFGKLRRLLMKNLNQWYSQHVPTEALPRDGLYPGDPRVAPLMEDGYSSGEDSFMATSIATAFAFEGTIPPMEDDGNINHSFPKNDSTRQPQKTFPQGVSVGVNFNECDTWADRLRANGTPSPQGRSFSPSASSNQSDLISDLASSRVEVADLKKQMAELTTSFEVQRSELIAFFKEEMSKSLTEQLNAFMQQHESPQKAQDTTMEQVVDLIRSQDLKFQALTDMVTSMMISSTTTSTGKRNPDDVYAHERAESPMDTPSDKRLDRKNSPSKQSRNKVIDGFSSSPSSPDHKEMDLSDDSLTLGGTKASSVASRGKDNTICHHD